MSIKYLTKRSPFPAVRQALDRDGCVVITDLIDSNMLDAVERELAPYFQDTPCGEGYFWGKKTKRMGGLFAKSPHCRDLAIDAAVLEIVKSILLEGCEQIQINLTQAIEIEPGEPEQILHRDDEVFPFPHEGTEFMMNALWALDDFTTENGATRIVLGSHREELDRAPPEDRVEYAVMAKGSVLIYLGSVVHGGGANKSTAPRRAVAMSYSLGWLKQAENQFLANPPEVARQYPEILQRLIGYQIHQPNLGWYEGQDPKVVLEGNASPTMAARDFLPEDVEEMLQERYEALVA